jgi:ankyrin repeat protein
MRALSSAGFKDVVQFLLENKAGVDAQDKSARTPVKVAHDFKRRDITELLIQHGSKRPADLSTEMFKMAMKKYPSLASTVRFLRSCAHPALRLLPPPPSICAAMTWRAPCRPSRKRNEPASKLRTSTCA